MPEGEVLVHLTDLSALETIMEYGLTPIKYGCVYFHRIRPSVKGSHNLDYMKRYARATRQGLLAVDPNALDQSDLLLRKYEAGYSDCISPELITVVVGGET